MSDNYLTFEQVSTRLVEQAARRVASQYGKYLVTTDDCKQEIYVWLYGKGRKWVEARLAKSPQQIRRIQWKLRAVAKSYAERQKAEKVGYDVSDLHWYTTNQIVGLLPLALDDTFAGFGSPDADSDRPRDVAPRQKKNPAETGDLVAMVLDIRRALDGLPEWVALAVRFQEPGEDLYDSAIGAILQYLGGPRDYVGKRRVMTNAEAQAKTGENYAG